MLQLKNGFVLLLSAFLYTSCSSNVPDRTPYQLKQAGIAAKRIVVSEGYPCDSVTRYELESYTASTLYCNNGNYRYRVVDHNGRILILKD